MPVCMKSYIAAFVWMLAATSSGSAREPEIAIKDLSVEQRFMARLAAQASALAVSAWADRADTTYVAGDAVTLFVKPNRDAYITVLDVGTSGRVTVLFPNGAQPDSRVEAHRTIRIGAAVGGYRLRVHGPIGREVIKVIATDKPLDLVAFNDSDAVGPFRVLRADGAVIVDRISTRLVRDQAGDAAMTTVVLRLVARSSKSSSRPATVDGA